MRAADVSGRAPTALIVAVACGALLVAGLVLLVTSGGERAPERGVDVVTAAPGDAGPAQAAGARQLAPPDEAEAGGEPSELLPAADARPAREQDSAASLRGGRSQPYVLQRWPAGAPPESSPVELVVVDGADRPVPGVHVEVLALASEERMLHVALELATDAAGRCTVAPQSEPSVVRASLDDRCSGLVQLGQLTSGDGPPRLVVVPLRGSFHAQGLVRLADGRPAPGVAVTVGAPGMDCRPSHVPPAPTTDAEGRFTLDGHLGEALIVRAGAGELASDWLDVAAAVAAGRPLLLRLPGAWRITGQAFGGDGQPVPLASLAFVPDPGDEGMLDPRFWRPLRNCLELETDEAGRFEIDVRTPGSGLLWSLSPSCALAQPVRVTLTPERSTVDVVLRAPELGQGAYAALTTIAGRVREESGEPQAGAMITADRVLPADFLLPDLETRLQPAVTQTDADGRFTLRGLAAGQRYDVQAAALVQPAAWRVFRADVATGAADLELVVGSEERTDAALHVRAVDAAGNVPLVAFRATVVNQQPARHEADTLVQDATEGVLLVEGLRRGARFDVLVRVEGYADGALADLVAVRDPEPATLRLKRNGALHVTVSDEHGPAACAWVEAERADLPASPRLHNVPAAARAGADGKLRLDNLWPGRWRLQCERDGRTIRAIAVVTPGGTVDVALTLR